MRSALGVHIVGIGLFCGAGAAAAPVDEAVAACRMHFATSGSFLTGRVYATYLELPAVTKPEAYSRIYAAVAKDGWTIANADKDAGIISAWQGVILGRGSTAPLLVVVEVAAAGIKATATFRTGGGQVAREDTIRAKLCSYLGAASP